MVWSAMVETAAEESVRLLVLKIDKVAVPLVVPSPCRLIVWLPLAVTPANGDDTGAALDRLMPSVSALMLWVPVAPT